jgi:hypothetical protein
LKPEAGNKKAEERINDRAQSLAGTEGTNTLVATATLRHTAWWRPWKHAARPRFAAQHLVVYSKLMRGAGSTKKFRIAATIWMLATVATALPAGAQTKKRAPQKKSASPAAAPIKIACGNATELRLSAAKARCW